MATQRYDYELFEKSEQIFGWHWHPTSKRSQITWPHFHMPQASRYKSAHIPTGRLALEDLLLFLIDEMDALPQLENARSIIEETRVQHRDHRHWA